MIIKKLNTVFHKHSKVLFGAFTLIIIVSFMGFLTPGQFGCNGGGGGGQTVGEAYGKKVSMDDLQEFHRKYTLLSQGGSEELRDIFYQYCLSVRADQLGIQVSDDEVAKAIAAYCTDKDGKYDEQKYRKFIGDLKKRGVSEDEVAEAFRLRLKFEKLEQYVLARTVVTPSEVDAVYRDYDTKLHFRLASVSVLRLKVATPKLPAAPKEQELKAFFAKNKAFYRCVKVAEFPFGKDAKAAEKKAEAFRKAVGNRAAAFDAEAKKLGVKVRPAIWIAADGEATGGAKLDDQLMFAIFSTDPKTPLTRAVSGKNAVYVACLVDAAQRNAAVEAKKLLEKHWRLEQSRKLLAEAVGRLRAIDDKSAQKRAFDALKNFTFAVESRPGASFGNIGEGEITSDGVRIYFVEKREIPVACVPIPTEQQLKDFYAGKKDNYRCVRVAEFRDGKDKNGKAVKAGERARMFCRTVNKQNSDKRAAEFDAEAKKLGIKVRPTTWVDANGEVSGGESVDGKLVGEIFATAPSKPLTKAVPVGDAVYVACLVDASKRNVAVEAKKLLEKHWRLEQSLKLAANESARLNKIADRAKREAAFGALKGFTFTDLKDISLLEYKRNGLTPLREGDTAAAGDCIYMLQKQVIPTGGVPEDRKPVFREICRGLKGRAAWLAFLEDLQANCRFLINRQEQR